MMKFTPRGWNGFGSSSARRRRDVTRQFRPGVDALEGRVVLTGGVSASYAVTSDWGTAFQAQVGLANTGAAPVANWVLGFDLGANVSSIWDAQVVSHVGNHYVIDGAAYDATLPANGAVSFGFVASPGHVAAPTNMTLNGVPIGGQPAPLPTLSVADAQFTESGGVTKSLLAFPVTLSQAETTPVTVAYATSDGTAHAGTDYQATTGTLTFPAGVTRGTVVVPVINANTTLPSETMTLTLSNPAGGTLSRATATGTILNPNAPTSAASVTYKTTSDWGTGFDGEVDITNGGATTLSAWSVTFHFSGAISSIWDGTIASHVGDQYVVTSAGWNDSIAPNTTASFGFVGAPGGGAAVPTNFVLSANGLVTGNDHPPVAVNDSATTTQGQSVNINVLANDTDPDNDPLTVASFTQPTHGTVTANTDGTLAYTPAAGYVGADGFTYVVSDGRGGTATGTVSVTVNASQTQGSTWPSRVFAPYVDMTLYPTYNLASASQASGTKFFTLAFVVADANNLPSWGGYTSYEINGGAFDQGVRSQVAAVRALGGDVAVSFGGENGQELAQAITSVPALTSAYQSVVNAYGLTHLDFDIEGAAVADHASIDRRSQALASLEQTAAAAGKPLQVWLTLPVLPTGLTADGLYVLDSAIKYGVKIAGVNGMAMDFGENAAPNPQGQMGAYAIETATSLESQIQTAYGTSLTTSQAWSMVGITPMIGLNDDTNEVFDQAAASQLTAFASQKGIGRISMWSLNRDQSDPKGAITYVEPTSSSLVQTPYQFSKTFDGYES